MPSGRKYRLKAKIQHFPFSPVIYQANKEEMHPASASKARKYVPLKPGQPLFEGPGIKVSLSGSGGMDGVAGSMDAQRATRTFI